jgi:hypothetical protein
VKPSGYHGAAKFAKGLPEPPEHLLCLQFPTDSRKFTARPLTGTKRYKKEHSRAPIQANEAHPEDETGSTRRPVRCRQG